MTAGLGNLTPHSPNLSTEGGLVDTLPRRYGEGAPSRYSIAQFLSIIVSHWDESEISPEQLSALIKQETANDDDEWHLYAHRLVNPPPSMSDVEDLQYDDPRYATLLFRLERIASMPEQNGVVHPRGAATYLAAVYLVAARENSDTTAIYRVFCKLPHPPPEQQQLRPENPRRQPPPRRR